MLAKCRIVRRQRTINFIGRDVQKAETLAVVRSESCAIAPGFLQQFPPVARTLTRQSDQHAASAFPADFRRQTHVRRYLGAALLMAAAACAKKQVAPTVQTATVTRRDIIVDAQANGVIEPIAIIEVKSKASGVITHMTVETGTPVKPGDLIVRFSVPAKPWFRRSLYLKIRDRESYEFALASAAVALDMDGDTVVAGEFHRAQL